MMQLVNMKKKRMFRMILLFAAMVIFLQSAYLYAAYAAEDVGGETLKDTAYSSNENFTDDILDMNSTQLDKDGHIYIQFNRQLSSDWQISMEDLTLSRIMAPKQDGYTFYTVLDTANTVYGDVYANLNDYTVNVSRKTLLTWSNKMEIVPNGPLENLSQYQLYINKDSLEGKDGERLEKNISVNFWTKASGDTAAPSWKAPGLSYTKAAENYYILNDVVPTYGFNTPIELSISGEVIPSAKDGQISGELYINQALKNISLAAADSTSDSLKIAKYEIKYETNAAQSTKDTKLYLYPERILDSGKTYRLIIPENVFQSRNGAYLPTFKMDFNMMGIPTVKSMSPGSGETVNEKNLTRLQVVFNDPDGNLSLYSTTAGLTNMRDSMVKALGSNVSMIDTDAINEILKMNESDRQNYIASNIFVKNATNKTATLYIPLKSLLSQTTYYVTLRPGIVTNDIGTNNEITWSFHTRSIPAVYEVSIGSVVEDYDEDEPIILRGDFFEDDEISVYFNDIRAHRVTVGETKDESGNLIEKTLKVYLPRGSRKLEAGMYNIKLVNDSDHSTVEYGAFSVIKKGENVPNSEYLVKGKEREGEIRGNLKVSEDTLLLDSRYSNDSLVTINLDDMMGQDVYVRKINYRGYKDDKIGILETKSKWSDITLYGVTLDNNSDSSDIIIVLGRVEPTVAQSLSKKARGTVKSDFIQVTGENYKMVHVSLKIPFRNSNGKNLKVLRYDEDTRNFYEVQGAVSLVDGIVNATAEAKGIFVVTEE